MYIIIDKKHIVIGLAITLLILVEFTATPLGNVDFFVGEGGGEKFGKGDIVYLKGKSLLATVVLDVKVDLLYPVESGRGSIIVLPRRTITFSGIKTIAEYRVQENDPTGVYTFRITAWDTNGNLLGQVDIPFTVEEEEQILPFQAIVAIIAAAAIIIMAIAVIKWRKTGEEKPPIIPESAKGSPPELGVYPPELGEKTLVVTKPGTISIQGPGGATKTIVAYFQFGSQIIPVSSIPQKFGREDFVGKVPADILNKISRRSKPHFQINYDYSRGCFIIRDDQSTNGTYVNGEDIRGKGWIELKNGDTVNLAGLINLRFITGPEQSMSPPSPPY